MLYFLQNFNSHTIYNICVKYCLALCNITINNGKTMNQLIQNQTVKTKWKQKWENTINNRFIEMKLSNKYFKILLNIFV